MRFGESGLEGFVLVSGRGLVQKVRDFDCRALVKLGDDMVVFGLIDGDVSEGELGFDLGEPRVCAAGPKIREFHRYWSHLLVR